MSPRAVRLPLERLGSSLGFSARPAPSGDSGGVAVLGHILHASSATSRGPLRMVVLAVGTGVAVAALHMRLSGAHSLIEEPSKSRGA